MLDSFPVSLAVGTVLGFLSGLGVGGGSLLILWLTLVLRTDPGTAREINLMFFLPAAAISCFFRWKQGALHFKAILPAILAGCCSAVLGSLLSTKVNAQVLKKAFGILLLAAGFREIVYKPKKKASP